VTASLTTPNPYSVLKLASPKEVPLASALPAPPPEELSELAAPVTSLRLSTCPPGVVADEALWTPVSELEVPELSVDPLAADVALAPSRAATGVSDFGACSGEGGEPAVWGFCM
jgi:hypothetical protein